MSNENSSEARADRKAAAAQMTPDSETRAARIARRSAANKAAEEQAIPKPSKKALAAGAAKRSEGRDGRLKQDTKKSRDERRAAAAQAAEHQANPPESPKEKAAREKREADAKAAAPEPQPEA